MAVHPDEYRSRDHRDGIDPASGTHIRRTNEAATEEANADEGDSASGDIADGAKDPEKPNSKSKPKLAERAGRSESDSEGNGTGNVSLLVRLYFSSHEKLSEQRWLDRIPTEEPFKSASPKVLRQGEAGFEEALKQFSDLD